MVNNPRQEASKMLKVAESVVSPCFGGGEDSAEQRFTLDTWRCGDISAFKHCELQQKIID